MQTSNTASRRVRRAASWSTAAVLVIAFSLPALAGKSPVQVFAEAFEHSVEAIESPPAESQVEANATKPPGATVDSQLASATTGPVAVPPAILPRTQTPRALTPGLAALSDELADLTERGMSSVVAISIRRPAPQTMNPFGFGFGPTQPQGRFAQGQGSGVIVSDDGLILTNHHVVDSATEVRVALPDGTETTATVVGSDPATDVAVVRLDDAPAGLVPLPFGDSDEVRAGQLCMAIGNPFGLDGSASLGIVSATGRDRMGITDYEDFIQTDTAINPGNSGGALIDMHGNLIGINTAIFSRSGGSQGIGFAIPANMARHIMDQLIEDGSVSRGWLGVQIAPVPTKVAGTLQLGAGTGVYIAAVDPDGPAADGGLRDGDVVTSVDGIPMNDVDQLRYLVADLGPGHRARVDVARADGVTRLEVELGQRPTRTAGAFGGPR